jgi:hypothetical protein
MVNWTALGKLFLFSFLVVIIGLLGVYLVLKLMGSPITLSWRSFGYSLLISVSLTFFLNLVLNSNVIKAT